MVKRVISYNVNGLRAAMSKGFMEWLEKEEPYAICLQEIKMQETQIDKMAFQYLGYNQFWNAAIKKGYSGVGILIKDHVDHFSSGMGITKFDEEGRIIRIDIGDLTIVNSYFPSGSSGDIRQGFKMEYLQQIMFYLDMLREQRPRILLNGDFNICHKPIDINHPEKHKRSSGFLPEERLWFDRLVDSGFMDTFREFDPRPQQYSWWSYRANSRAKNLGWRIDYNMVTTELSSNLLNAGIMQDIHHSDHCPVWVDLEL